MKNQITEYWSGEVVEYWGNELAIAQPPNTPPPRASSGGVHYSITPLLHHSILC